MIEPRRGTRQSSRFTRSPGIDEPLGVPAPRTTRNIGSKATGAKAAVLSL